MNSITLSISNVHKIISPEVRRNPCELRDDNNHQGQGHSTPFIASDKRCVDETPYLITLSSDLRDVK